MTVTAQLNVTPDGFCNHDDVAIDEAFMAFAIECLERSDLVLLGRKTYDLFVAHWPSAARDPQLPEAERRLGQAIDGTERTVVSSTMASSDWEGTTILSTLDRGQGEALRRDNRLLILGSPSIIGQFAQWGLIDSLLLSVQPLIAGKGIRLFDRSIPEEMEFVGRRETGSGVQTYEFRRAIA